jgi:hypothetical protein
MELNGHCIWRNVHRVLCNKMQADASCIRKQQGTQQTLQLENEALLAGKTQATYALVHHAHDVTSIMFSARACKLMPAVN